MYGLLNILIITPVISNYIMYFYFVFILCFCAQLGKAVYDNFTFDRTVAIQTDQKQLWNETNQDKLKKDLLVNYDREARPTEHFNVTVVRFGIAILNLHTDEKKSTVTANVWLRAVWTDPKLQWNPEDYNNVSILKIASHEIWEPDIYLYNSVSGGEVVFYFGTPHALVYPTGEVLMVPPAKQTVLCEFDLRYWPFDTQHCQLKYGFWLHNGLEIELKLYNNQPSIDISDFLTSMSWNITNSTGEVDLKYYDCCPEPYHSISFNFTIKRNPNTYAAIVVTPSVVTTILILAQFWLPPKCKQKLYLNGFLLIILSTYLMYFVDTLGPTVKNIPIILQFYAWSLYITCFGIIINNISILICKSKKLIIIEIYARRFIRGRIATVLLLDNDNVDSDFNTPITNENEDGDDEKRLYEYFNDNICLFAQLLNRLLFWIYVIIIFVVVLTV